MSDTNTSTNNSTIDQDDLTGLVDAVNAAITSTGDGTAFSADDRGTIQTALRAFATDGDPSPRQVAQDHVLSDLAPTLAATNAQLFSALATVLATAPRPRVSRAARISPVDIAANAIGVLRVTEQLIRGAMVDGADDDSASDLIEQLDSLVDDVDIIGLFAATDGTQQRVEKVIAATRPRGTSNNGPRVSTASLGSFRSFVDAGKLPNGTKLTHTNADGTVLNAVIRKGAIVVGTDSFTSPSTAANAALGIQNNGPNGWDFWMVGDVTLNVFVGRVTA